MNPKAIAVMWSLTLFMAGAIALGPICIAVVAVLVALYTVWGIS